MRTPVFRWLVGGGVALAALTLVACGGGRSSARATPAERLQIEMTSPRSSMTVTDGSMLITGIVSNAGATLTVNDAPLELSAEGAFQVEMPITYGSNRVSLRASKEGMTSASRSMTITRQLRLEILEPETDIVSTQRRIMVNGTVSDRAARVFVNGSEITLREDGSFSTPVNLHYVLTTINVSTLLDGVPEIKRQLNVRLDAGAA